MLVPRASQVLRLYKAQACRIRRTMASAAGSSSWFDPLDTFPRRHVGPDRREEEKMLSTLGYASMAEFENATVPAHIRVASGSVSDSSIRHLSESELLRHADELAAKNDVFKSYIGMGYHTAVVPPVILRNVLISRFPISEPLSFSSDLAIL